MTEAKHPLRAVVVGCNMGRNQANTLAMLAEYELVAVCDLNEATAKQTAANCGDPAVYTDYEAMLEEQRPDLVVIATPNGTHAAFAQLAAEAGVSGIYCEKPMATNLADARSMAAACEERGITLVIGHQRRMSNVYRRMKELANGGDIGDIRLIRGQCAGDLLSDASHLVDSILYLLNDQSPKRVVGQVTRKAPASMEERERDPYAFTGMRYGHAVESGAMASIEFEDDVRAELLVGDLRVPGSGYQDIEIVGTKGTIWRKGDHSEPQLLISDESEGGYRPVEIEPSTGSVFEDVFRAMADSMRNGIPHPMDGKVGLLGLEILLAIFESARLRSIVELPLMQVNHPLELMLQDGQFCQRSEP